MSKNKNIQKILITGVPYSGKSYVSAFLKKYGKNVIDTDNIKDLKKWFDKNGNIVDFPKDATKEWLDTHNFLWDKKILLSWIKKQKSTIYLFGLANNIFEVIDLFDKTYYLNISPKILKKRFTKNKRTNPMGKTKEQQMTILNDLDNFIQKSKEKGLIFIQADKTPERIFKIITS